MRMNLCKATLAIAATMIAAVAQQAQRPIDASLPTRGSFDGRSAAIPLAPSARAARSAG